MKRIRDFFIDDFLQAEPDLIRRASIRLIFNICVLSIATLIIIFFVYLINGFYYQQIKSVLIILLFVGCLFFVKAKRSITEVSHILILISFTNVVIDIFFLFQDFNMFAALISVMNIVFAFHLLGKNWGLFYSSIHFVVAMLHFLLMYYGIVIIDIKPQRLSFAETLISFTLIFFICVYLVYHYHKAFELTKASIKKSMKELGEAKDRAEEMNKLKTNFLANMSHEIRTPINGILGISQIIELETKDEKIKEYIALQKQSGNRLLSTITSILNLSRMEAEKDSLQLRAVDIVSLVHENIKTLGELARAKDLVLEVDADNQKWICLSDEQMLYQVLSNIIGNAIKFTEQGGVSITFSSMEINETSFVNISVSDTGIGISPAFMAKLFNPFEQESEGTARNYQGSGLGLSISKKYMELLGGDIRVKSQKSQGSTFEIVLPLIRTDES